MMEDVLTRLREFIEDEASTERVWLEVPRGSWTSKNTKITK